ncbi:hypothetical protein EJ02DRAFT_48303 [Clathrospora elynae]|uniref:RING-type domain-containing protein n=1 Tax=Clathrospora elynae TaxID=706981 RepID=A0A6A5SDV2_9PLEO|nr:hypothetical protein EJ02DRAFT_48303 [Clathrospora elynae]
MPLSSFQTLPRLSGDTSKPVRNLKILKQTRIVPLPTASPDEACCICLSLYGPLHEAVTVLVKDCYHRFGQNCLEDYLNSDSPRNNTCPQCRREWYTRQPVWTAPRDTNTTQALTPFSQLRAHVRSVPQARVHRRQRTLEHDQTTNNRVINGHLDEIFRRLDSIQGISNQQHTSTADTRVRLQAVERRARRIYQALQVQQELRITRVPPVTLRGYETHRPARTPSHTENLSRRRWMEAFAVELDDDPNLLTDGNRTPMLPASRSSAGPVETSERPLQRSNNAVTSFSPRPHGPFNPPPLSRPIGTLRSTEFHHSRIGASTQHSVSPGVDSVLASTNHSRDLSTFSIADLSGRTVDRHRDIPRPLHNDDELPTRNSMGSRYDDMYRHVPVRTSSSFSMLTAGRRTTDPVTSSLRSNWIGLADPPNLWPCPRARERASMCMTDRRVSSRDAVSSQEIQPRRSFLGLRPSISSLRDMILPDRSRQSSYA